MDQEHAKRIKDALAATEVYMKNLPHVHAPVAGLDPFAVAAAAQMSAAGYMGIPQVAPIVSGLDPNEWHMLHHLLGVVWSDAFITGRLMAQSEADDVSRETSDNSDE